MSHYLCFDPGETTGWATFDADGAPVAYGQVSGLDGLMEFLNSADKPKLIICEDYVVLPQKAKAHTGSRIETVQAIGVIKAFAKQWGCEVFLQPAQIKKIAEMWSGIKPIGAHKNSHWVDAYNHGYYYLVKNHIRKSRLQEDVSKAHKNAG